MKAKLIIIAILSAPIFFGSCITLSDNRSNDRDALLFETASYIAASEVLSAATSEEDRVKKAEVIYIVSSKLRSFNSGGVPEPSELNSLVFDAIPAKSHWASLAIQIAKIYADEYIASTREDVRYESAMKTLDAIASGCEKAAAQYLSEAFLDSYNDGVVEPFLSAMPRS